MRKAVVVLVVGVALVLATLGPGPSLPTYAGVNTDTPTPTGTLGPVHFPMVFKQPTLTPTRTSTPTRTPTATSTSSPCGTGLNGHLESTDNKPTYATYIERVRFTEYIFNGTAQTICFGILGIAPSGPQQLPFKTSWDGAGAPGGRLEIWAGCHGPAGIPCAGSSGAGAHIDHLGDGAEEHTQNEITTPGTYNATLYVCYSPFSACLVPGGAWASISAAVPFNMIHWTPSAPLTDGQVEPTAVPDKGPVCYLITDDPAGIYLKCSGKQMKSMPHRR